MHTNLVLLKLFCGYGLDGKWERNEVLETNTNKTTKQEREREREINSTTHSHIKRASGSFSLHQKASLYH
jgi:hypothetical protein